MRTTVPLLSGPPLVGHLYEFRSRRLALLERAAHAHPTLCRLRLAGMPIVLVSSAELAHTVLVAEPARFEKGAVSLELFPSVLGRGLLTSTGDEHRRHRKLLTPVFSPRRFADYFPAIADEVERASAGWAHGATIDLAAELVQLTLRVTLRTLLGSERTDEARVIVESLTTALGALERSLLSPLPLPLDWPLPNNLRRRRAVARLDAVVVALVAERRRAPRDDGSILQLLMQARDDESGAGLDDRQVRDQLVTFLAAGTDTLAHALGWSAYLLMRHERAWERLRAEADALAALDDELAYGTQVLKEAMRLYPPSYLHDRRVAEETTLGAHRLPAGTMVWINAWGIHRRGDYWAEPERFAPERFEGDGERRLLRCAYLPFGSGPRACIGAGLALATGPLMLALLARRFRFSLATARAVEPQPRFTVSPKGGLPVRVERRATAAAAPPAAPRRRTRPADARS